MFVAAIDKASRFTRPVHIIQRLLDSAEVHPGAGTLFVVNAEGWALTCRHVAEQILSGNQLEARYASFKAERDALPAKNRRQLGRALAKKYGFGPNSPVEIKSRFVNCVTGDLKLSLRLHPDLDIALLKFEDFCSLGVNSFPVFAARGSLLHQGHFMCRLGFPFPEFTNYEYDAATDSIGWTSGGRAGTPQFPIDGMVTRHLLLDDDSVGGFELSTPGLRGQSGGPAFDTEGRVWGMQCATAHLDLNFDVDLEVTRQGRKKRIAESALLHVGHCVHVDRLRDFMEQHNVHFDEG